MFKDKQIVELLEDVLRELRQIKSALRCNILKQSCRRVNKEGGKDNG